MVKNRKKFKKLTKEYKDKKWDEWSEQYKNLWVSLAIPSIIYFVWMFLGLLTFNWILFAVIILFNVSIINLISKPFRYNKIYTLIHWLNSIIGFIFGLFVLINSYHLKIDLLEIIKDWF